MPNPVPPKAMLHDDETQYLLRVVTLRLTHFHSYVVGMEEVTLPLSLDCRGLTLLYSRMWPWTGHNWGPLPSPTTDWSSVPLSVLTPFRLLPRLQGMHSSVISFPRLVTDPCPEPLGLGAWGSLYQTYRTASEPNSLTLLGFYKDPIV